MGMVAPFLAPVETKKSIMAVSHSYDLLHQIVLGDHGIEADHHEGDIDPVIIFSHNE
jgi:hypothetical protein